MNFFQRVLRTTRTRIVDILNDFQGLQGQNSGFFKRIFRLLLCKKSWFLLKNFLWLGIVDF